MEEGFRPCGALRNGDVGTIPPNMLLIDYPSPLSATFEATVPEQVYRNIRLFKRRKDIKDTFFDKVEVGCLRLTGFRVRNNVVKASALAAYLGFCMPGLTSKMFHIFNTSTTLQKLLDEGTPEDANASGLLLTFSHARRITALFCNYPVEELDKVLDPRYAMNCAFLYSIPS